MNADCLHCGLPCPQHREYCCYGCEFVHGLSVDAALEGESTRSRVAICAFFTMNLMAVSVLTYADEFQDAAEEPGMAALRTAFRWASALFATPIVAILGVPMARSAVDGLRQGRATAELLITLAAASAYLYSWASLVTGTGAIYFDAACMTLVLMGAGRAIEATARARAMEAVGVVGRNSDRTVLRLGLDGAFARVDAEQVRRGDVLRIPAGGSSPVDATISAGTAFVDASIVTGEAQPFTAIKGMYLPAGAVVLGASLDVEAVAAADRSTTADLESAVRRAQRERAPVERAADRMAAILVPSMLLVAIATALRGWHAGDVAGGFAAAVAVLIVACPCTFGIATPLAMAAAVSRAARAGIVVRSAAAVERLARIRAVVFDKTGTLTSLVPNVTVSGVSDDDLAAVLACESAVHHPIADALEQEALSRNLAMRRADDVRVEPEGGVSGVVEGRRIFVGGAALARRLGAIGEQVTEKNGEIFVLRDRQVIGTLRIEERLRDGATQAVRRLHDLHLHAEVLTGDGEPRAAEVAGRVGLDFRSGSTPAEKLARIETLEREVGPTLMVGDGTNDGPALARASLGMTIAPTSELAKSIAPIYVPQANIESVPEMITLAKRALRVVHTNLAWAVAYNLVCVVLAASGRLSPLAAALAMLLSSATVIANSLRVLRPRAGEPLPQAAANVAATTVDAVDSLAAVPTAGGELS
jgi:heavy metal translocating P-type ATPase